MKFLRSVSFILGLFVLGGSARATVPSASTWIQVTLTTNPQVIPVTFVFQATSDLLVLDSKASPPVILTQNSDYTVTGGAGSTGTVTTIVGGAHAVAVGDVITISRRVPLTQTTTYSNSGPLTAAMIGASFDKLTTITQQLNLVGANSLQFQGDEAVSGVLPLTARKGKVLGFNATTGAVEFVTNGGSGSGVSQIIAGTNVTINPTGGTGAVTINASGSGGGAVDSVQGTANQVLVNGTSGSAQTGALTLTLPQSIGTVSQPVFAGVTAFGASTPYFLAQSNTNTATPTIYANNNSNATFGLSLGGSAASGTTFGLSNNNLAYILANASGGTYPSAVAIGTSNNTPVIFGVNGAEVGRFTTAGLAVSSLNGGTSASSSTYWRGDGTWATPAGAGTVTSIPDGTTNGVTWTVATRTSTPTFTFSLGAITPSSINVTSAGSGASPGIFFASDTTTGFYRNAANSIAFSSSGTAMALFTGTGIQAPIGQTTPQAGSFTTLAASTPLGVASGGTGLATLTANNVILGNGTSTPSFVAPGSSGNVLKSNGTTWVSGTVSGTGDVVGPASSTDNALVRFDSTTGKLIQNSVVIVNDSGDVTATSLAASGTAYANYGIYNDSTITSNGTNAIGFANVPTLTAAVNSDVIFQERIGGTIAKGAFTGITLYGKYLANPSVSGAGTITNHYGLYIETPTRGTTNYSIYSAGGLNFFGGNTALAASNYLNWGTTSGSSGYGIRDNGGTLQFKNSAGSWNDVGVDGVTSSAGAPSAGKVPLLNGSGQLDASFIAGGVSDYLATLSSAEISITSATTATISRQHVVSGTSSNYTLTLPAVSGNTGKFLLVRISPGATKLFTVDSGAGSNIDGASTTLASAIVSSISTSIIVTSAAGFPTAPFAIQIDSEILLVTAGFGTTTWTVTRGVQGTTAATHLILAATDYFRTRVMWAGEAAFLYCDGASWRKLFGKSIPMLCSIRRDANQSLTGGVPTKVLFNATDLDNAGQMADLANNKIAIVRPSYYSITGQSFFSALASNEPNLASKVYLNGADLYDSNSSGLSAGYVSAPIVSKVISMSLADYVELYAFSDANQTLYGTPTGPASFITLTENVSW